VPTYDYNCLACDTTFETTRSYKERETEVVCPTCNQASTRIYSVGGIQFKGSGFYKTGG